jgi:hypothetical protein
VRMDEGGWCSKKRMRRLLGFGSAVQTCHGFLVYTCHFSSFFMMHEGSQAV